MAPERTKHGLVVEPRPDHPYRYARMQLGPHDNLVYLVADPATNKAAVIDPAFEVDRILDMVNDWKVDLDVAFFTHRHPDHTNGAKPIQDATDCDLVIHNADADVLTDQGLRVKTVDHNDLVTVGEVPIKAHHTPGHTAGGLTYQAEKRLFTGDFLFVDTCGRTDFPTGSKQTIWKSLQWFKQNFSDDHILCPGHDYGHAPEATLGTQRRDNPALAHETYDAFEDEWFLVAY